MAESNAHIERQIKTAAELRERLRAMLPAKPKETAAGSDTKEQGAVILQPQEATAV